MKRNNHQIYLILIVIISFFFSCGAYTWEKKEKNYIITVTINYTGILPVDADHPVIVNIHYNTPAPIAPPWSPSDGVKIIITESGTVTYSHVDLPAFVDGGR